jgi:hypothetical protein
MAIALRAVGVCGMTVKARAPLIAALVVVCAASVSGGSRLRLKVNAQVAYAPMDLWIYVGVERRPENRLLRVSAESGEFLRSSEVQLEGERSAPANTFRFRELPSGFYIVEARVLDSFGKTTSKEEVYVNVW